MAGEPSGEAMTARDEAIDAMYQVTPEGLRERYGVSYMAQLGRVLDAIPSDVLVRLAIERGALEELKYATYPPPYPVYRVVEP